MLHEAPVQLLIQVTTYDMKIALLVFNSQLFAYSNIYVSEKEKKYIYERMRYFFFQINLGRQYYC